VGTDLQPEIFMTIAHTTEQLVNGGGGGDNINLDCKEAGCGVVDWICVSQIRD
jgi:hypothetical protein